MVQTGIIIAVVIGLSEVFKRLGLNTKFVPIANLILGIALNLLVNNTGNFGADIFNGIVIGLTASGLYSGVKNVTEGIRNK